MFRFIGRLVSWSLLWSGAAIAAAGFAASDREVAGQMAQVSKDFRHACNELIRDLSGESDTSKESARKNGRTETKTTREPSRPNGKAATFVNGLFDHVDDGIDFARRRSSQTKTVGLCLVGFALLWMIVRGVRESRRVAPQIMYQHPAAIYQPQPMAYQAVPAAYQASPVTYQASPVTYQAQVVGAAQTVAKGIVQRLVAHAIGNILGSAR